MTAKQARPYGSPLPYYKPATQRDLNKLKQNICTILDEGKEKKILTNEEYKMMQPQDKGPGRFYQILKVHKSYPEGSLPPGRPIISGNGSITENLSKYVDFHTKPLVEKIESHLQDTPHFLRILDIMNRNNQISDSDILVTIDVTLSLHCIPTSINLRAFKT